MRFTVVCLVIVLLQEHCLASPLSAQEAAGIEAREAREGVLPGVTFRFDNDVLAHTDRCYTGGMVLGWESGTIPAPASRQWLAWLPWARRPGAVVSLDVRIGQKIYTPDNIRVSEVLRDDRPYAGVLFLAAGIPIREDRHQYLLEIMAGLVGPAAQGRSSQSLIH